MLQKPKHLPKVCVLCKAAFDEGHKCLISLHEMLNVIVLVMPVTSV